MYVIPRHELTQWLRRSGLEVESRTFPGAPRQTTVREVSPPPFVKGPHRKWTHSRDTADGPTPVCNRPPLSAFVATAFHAIQAPSVIALVPEGTFWLNNKSLTLYLSRVPDAVTVSAFLRRRGLTDRFCGGFLVGAAQFDDILPQLAANTFSGGSDVLFAAVSGACLSVLACSHFDLHLASPDVCVLDAVITAIPSGILAAESMEIPDDADLPLLWNLEAD